MKRRSLLKAALATAGGLALGLKARVARAAARIRPPGALAPAVFEGACIRCFRCAEVCPVKAIRFEARGAGRDDDLPFLEVRDRACVLCMKCTVACPTGALAGIAPEKAAMQARVRMGRPVLSRPRCIPWRNEGVCRACYYVCPYPDSAVVLVGPQQAPLFEPDACVGCGLCEQVCPDRARAIVIEPFAPERKA